jgi:hypothetical protein
MIRRAASLSPVPDLSSWNNTITARWHRNLAGVALGVRSHWRTKTAYYTAVDELLGTCQESRLSWRLIADAVRPKGNRSTFYEVTGPHAKHPLIGDFIASDRVEALELAWSYHKSTAVEQLIHEAKVWAYWPQRETWLAQRAVEPDLDVAAAVDSLLAVVAAWARDNPRLAAAVGYAPPACAVEDLLLLSQGQLAAGRAIGLLTGVLRRAVDASTELADARISRAE